MKEERIDLEFRRGGSDKVYRLEMLQNGDLWIVNGWNARRGQTLKIQPKTPTPVRDYQAKAIYDEILREKLAKGYTPMGGSAGGQYSAPSSSEKIDTGIYPELLIPIKDESLLEKYFKDPNYWGQQKHDGERRPLKRDESTCIGINKKGFEVPIADSIKIAMAAFKPTKFVMDSEDVSEVCFVFDLLENGKDYRNEPYERRWARLTALFETAGAQDRLVLVETAKTETEKRAMFEKLKQDGKEGMVFKDKNAKHGDGETGNQFKWQWRPHAAVIVTKVNQKNSISIHVLDSNGSMVPVGNVTVYSNIDPKPKAGDVVECTYLKFASGGSLYQPVLLGVRTDSDPQDCRLDKLSIRGDSK